MTYSQLRLVIQLVLAYALVAGLVSAWRALGLAIFSPGPPLGWYQREAEPLVALLAPILKSFPVLLAVRALFCFVAANDSAVLLIGRSSAPESRARTVRIYLAFEALWQVFMTIYRVLYAASKPYLDQFVMPTWYTQGGTIYLVALLLCSGTVLPLVAYAARKLQTADGVALRLAA